MQCCYIFHTHTGNRVHALVFGDAEATVRTLLQCRSAGVVNVQCCGGGLLLSKRPRISKRKVPVIRDARGLIKNRTAVEQVERGVHCLLGAIVAWGYGALSSGRLGASTLRLSLAT